MPQGLQPARSAIFYTAVVTTFPGTTCTLRYPVMNSNPVKVSSLDRTLSSFKSPTSMIRPLLQLSAVLIAFAGITSTASADNQARKLDKDLFLGKYQVVDKGPILEDELVVTPSRTVEEEEISAPQ